MQQAWPFLRTSSYPFLWPFCSSQVAKAHTVWFHSCALWRKRDFVETVLVIIILLTCCQYRVRREKITAKADKLITSVKIGRLSDVDVHSNFGTLVRKSFLSIWCGTFLRKRENDVFFLDTWRFLLHQIYENDHSMWCLWEINIVVSKHELNICEFESQDATKTSSASAHSRVNFFWMIMSFWVRTIAFVFGSYDHFSVFPYFLPAWWPCHHHHRVVFTGWTDGHEGRRENRYYEALAFSRHNINWVLMRREWSQKVSERHLKTQALIPIPWERAKTTKNQLAKMTTLILRLQLACTISSLE